MEFLYNFNALPFFNEEELLLKDYLTKIVSLKVKNILLKQNKSWQFHQIEAPCLMPMELVNANYTNTDLWIQESINHADITLKPETTASSYLYLEHLLSKSMVLPPVVVWQVSKSFRREQDQSMKHCRFKEFYQQEFQCLYSADSKNNYQENVIEDLAKMFMEIICLPTRIVLSDSFPDYSIKTIDIEVYNSEKWMEVCSVSLRKDFKYRPNIKNKLVDCLVLEIALGIERLIYNINKRSDVLEQVRVDNQLI